MNELAVTGSRLTLRRASPALALCVALVAASAAIGEAPPAERAGAEAPPVGARAAETADQVRHGIVELRRELWRVEEMLALTPIEVGEAIPGAEQARVRVESALFDLQARSSRPELATDRALRDELERARGELSALRARLDRRIARRAEVGPPAPLAVQREAGDLEIIATSPHATCEKALEISPGRVRGILRPETWFRLRIPKPMRVAFRAESLGTPLAVSLHGRCGGAERAMSGPPERLSRVSAEVPEGEVWVRVSSGGALSRETFTLESVLAAGGISGRVRRVADGTAVAYVGVEIRTLAGNLLRWGRTQVDGYYSITELSPGSYLVAVVDTAELISERFDDRRCPLGVGCPVTEGDPVVVQDSTTTQNVDFDLALGGMLGGHVVLAPEGTPSSGANVSLFDAGGRLLAYAGTEALGRYSFQGLLGEYRAAAVVSGRAQELFEEMPCIEECPVVQGTPILIESAAGGQVANFTLERLGSVSGRVTLANGTPVDDATVAIDPQWPSGMTTYVWTGPDGAFSASGLQPGEYVVWTGGLGLVPSVLGGTDCTYQGCAQGWSCDFESGTPIHVQVGAPVVGVDIVVRPLQPIEGTITRAENGLSLAGVAVFAGSPAGCNEGWGESGGTGAYSIPGLPPASYRVYSSNNLGYINEVYSDFACGYSSCGADFTPVPVGLADPTLGIDFSLVRGATISGSIVDALGTPLASCQPARVQLHRVGGSPSYMAFGCASLPGGAFSFVGLPAGIYAVSVTSDEYFDELFDNVTCPTTCDPGAGTPIEVVLGQDRVGIDFVLDRPGRVDGSVVEAETGSPAPFASVTAVDAAGTVLAGGGTDWDGNFSLRVPTPQTFYLVATDIVYERELYPEIACPGELGLDCIPVLGTPLSVGINGQISGFGFTLRRAPAIRGRVLQAPDGRPAVGAVVDLFSTTSPDRISSAIAGPMGNFEVLLSRTQGPGAFVLATDNAFGAIDEIWQDVPCPNGPAWLGLCDITLGTPIVVRAHEVVEGIVFVLSGWPVFKNGFENGSLVGWSGAESQ